ncbi:DUF3649 domain-containing protein [Limnobacter parvus]|uniref:DUF3649 domain-containing protein n=1 Tax=Limnobacter parvus TaxID=2939690 RepID=UPI00353041C2
MDWPANLSIKAIEDFRVRSAWRAWRGLQQKLQPRFEVPCHRWLVVARAFQRIPRP